jgi:transposase
VKTENLHNEPKRITQILNGVSYIYEDTPYWDKSLKQNRHKRKCIGKLGPDNNFLPNNYFLMRQQPILDIDKNTSNKVLVKRCYYGATYLLNEISKITGVSEDLQLCFPLTHKQILSLAYFLIMEKNPFYRFPIWNHDHWHPYESNIPSQRISEIIASIQEHSKLEFFTRQSQRRMESEYLAYDTTSISSLSKLIKAVRYGVNKDHDKLPQVNLAMLFGEKSGLPVYYRVLPGNITDMTTLNKLIHDITFIEIKELKLVMDRGFYSAKNINELYKGNFKFLMAMKKNLKFISNFLADAKNNIRNISHHDNVHRIHHMKYTDQWSYEGTDNYGNKIIITKNIFIHIYHDHNHEIEELNDFENDMAKIISSIKEGKTLSKEDKQLSQKYLHISKLPELYIEYNQNAVKKHIDDFGFFILLSNDISDSVEAIDIYRKRDMVEKAFFNLKNRLECDRTEVHSDRNLEGKCFVHFISLIIISFIDKVMKKNNLYNKYTIHTLVDNLDIIERYNYPQDHYHCNEITKKQADLYSMFHILPPLSEEQTQENTP